jgi:hypothetical protein
LRWLELKIETVQLTARRVRPVVAGAVGADPVVRTVIAGRSLVTTSMSVFVVAA